MKLSMNIPVFLVSMLSAFKLSYSISHTLSGGSSLSVENAHQDILISPNGLFSAGFYPVGDNAYSFAVWFSTPPCINDNCTVVWMANRDYPVNGRRSRVLLQETGNLILTDAGRSIAWSTETVSNSAIELHLNDSGNLVLQNLEGVVLWQSFDFPTDTLLPFQELTRYRQLVSSRSRSNFSSGFYRLFFDDQNLLRLVYDGPDASSVYWPPTFLLSWAAGRFSSNSSRIGLLDSLGNFASSDNFTFHSSDSGVRRQRRLTLDFDGNLRLYSLEEGSTTWFVSWQAISIPCQIHGICGPNATCSYSPSSGRRCSCLPGYRIKNTTDWSHGCEPELSLPCGNETQADFLHLSRVEFYGNDISYHGNYTVEMCKQLCLQSCNCKGFQIRYLYGPVPNCYFKNLLVNGHHSPQFFGDFYLKVPKTHLFSDEKVDSEFGLDCTGEALMMLGRTYQKSGENGTLKFMLWFSCGLGGVEILCVLAVCCFLIRTSKDSSEATKGYQVAATRFKRFSYSELKRGTGNFNEEIGRGAGGIVYKGKLSDNRVVAIKQLNVANQGEAEFLAEVSTIGKLNHMNLIDMWGYCAEGKHRLLVYEYMEHGSLAENLSSHALDWQRRFDIALGTARGLAYLHEECLEWILHCDIKPQNILLDSNYQPKVSDFGLSKLLKRGEVNTSNVSKIRGTRGYMAPEWVLNQPITSKVDVYSYGIVVLELMTGRSSATGIHDEHGNGEAGDMRLVTWARGKKNRAKDGEAAAWIEEIIDPMLEGEYDQYKMGILLSLALQCAEEDKDARPSMNIVVETLMRDEHDH